MKTIIYENYGPPEVLKLIETPNPIPKDNELLIKVISSTVNRTDCGFLRANPAIVRLFSGLFSPRNKTLGNEFSGRVEAVGEKVTLFKPGDKVFGYNDDTFGAHAEYITISENKWVALMPENLTYKEAAAITEGSHYALSDIRAANIQNGQKVLIYGTTGAIGSAALQIIKHIGAEVTAVCDTRNIELVKSLGADEIIDYTKQDFTKLNKTFDLVFDAVGKSSFLKCRRILKNKGIYVSTDLGYMSQNVIFALFTPIFRGKRVLFPIPRINKEIITYLKNLVVSGKFKPIIDRVYTLEQIIDAFTYVESGQKVGNVIINIGNES